jgi:predicted PurR-regulated permease PerM
LYWLRRVVLLLVLATWIAYVLDPLVHLVERPVRISGRLRRLPRGAATGLVYVVIASAICAAAMILLPRVTEQVDDIVARAPAYTQSILAWEHGWSRYYERLKIPIELRQTIDQSVIAVSAAVVDDTRSFALAVVGSLALVPWLVLIPVLGFFFLKDASSIRCVLLKALPHAGRLRSRRLFEDINATLAAYMRAQLLACVIVGTISGVGFAVLGFQYSVVLGVLAGVLEFIPLVGPLTIAVVAAVIGALQTPILALWAVGFLGALRVLEDYVIYPRLLGRSVHLHPLAVIVAVLGGAELNGVAGMFLAIPVVAVGSVVFRHWVGWDGPDLITTEDACDATALGLTQSAAAPPPAASLLTVLPE